MMVEIETDIYLSHLRQAHKELGKIKIPVKEENLDMIMAKSTATANLYAIIKNIESRIEEKKEVISELAELFREEGK